MTGVEILAIEEAVVSNEFNYRLFGFLLTISIAVIVIIYLAAFGTERFIDNIEFLGIALAIVIGICVLTGWATAKSQYETQYKVSVSDEVSMNEFLEQYEIIEQQGKIYTVREREQVGAE